MGKLALRAVSKDIWEESPFWGWDLFISHGGQDGRARGGSTVCCLSVLLGVPPLYFSNVQASPMCGSLHTGFSEGLPVSPPSLPGTSVVYVTHPQSQWSWMMSQSPPRSSHQGSESRTHSCRPSCFPPPEAC